MKLLDTLSELQFIQAYEIFVLFTYLISIMEYSFEAEERGSIKKQQSPVINTSLVYLNHYFQIKSQE